MAMIAECLKTDGEPAAQVLRKAREQLAHADGEIVLQFAGVHRLAPNEIQMMEELAAVADQESIKIGLRGVNVGIYKVLKLVRLAPRFSFLT